jgi:cyclic pyranopterin phosphate synthase
MPPAGVPKRTHQEILRFEEIVRFVRVLKSRLGLSKVHLTGGEPLLRRGVVDLVSMLAKEGLADIALTTNAQALAELAEPLRRAGLGRVNVSLDTLRPQRFRKATVGGDLGRTIEGLDAAIRAGLQPVKINMVVVRGYNFDEVADLAAFGIERGCQVRFLELMPLGPAAQRYQEWFVPSVEVLARLGETFALAPMAPARPDQTSRSYRAVRRDGTGTAAGVVGVISSCTTPFCGLCRRLRLTARGELIGCLARGEGAFIRPILDDEPALMEAVRAALAIKGSTPQFSSKKVMSAVGG